VREGQVELVLANAAHIRNVPGCKTDMNDATWIADLLAHGLITASMIPPTPIQELRDLTRTRRQLVREIGQHTQRVQRVLEDANVKLSSVITDILGRSGRRILDALVAGETDPETLAALGSERLRCAAACRPTTGSSCASTWAPSTTCSAPSTSSTRRSRSGSSPFGRRSSG